MSSGFRGHGHGHASNSHSQTEISDGRSSNNAPSSFFHSPWSDEEDNESLTLAPIQQPESFAYFDSLPRLVPEGSTSRQPTIPSSQQHQHQHQHSQNSNRNQYQNQNQNQNRRDSFDDTDEELFGFHQRSPPPQQLQPLAHRHPQNPSPLDRRVSDADLFGFDDVDPFDLDLDESPREGLPPPPPSNQRAANNNDLPRRSEYVAVLDDDSDDPFGSPGFDFEDFFGHIERTERAPSHITERSPTPMTRGSVFLDLTTPSPEMAPITRKRKATATPSSSRATKAPRRSTAKPKKEESDEEAKSPADVVDLVDVDDDTKYEEFRAKQQADLLRQQLEDDANKPIKLSEFQCIICMDNPTDLTVTHCGHLFCSECLHQALYAGNAKKCCPVCRTAINTTLTGREGHRRQPKNGVFALEMKLMTANKKGKQASRG